MNRHYTKDPLPTALWAAFWLYILTHGDPDLVGAIVGILEGFSG